MHSAGIISITNDKEENDTRLLFNWNDCISESEKEYFSRTRKIKLLKVMKDIIENELDETQKKILKMKHYDSRSNSSISKELYMSPSGVLRNLKKSEKTISAYMKYVFVFSGLREKDSDKPLDVKTAIADMLLEHGHNDKIGERLKKSRCSKYISEEKAALCTNIDKQRIIAIEQSGVLSVSELKKLIAFYGVSADYIIFGAE